MRVSVSGDATFGFSLLNLGDLTGDDRAETLIALSEIDGDSSPHAAVLMGEQVTYSSEIAFDDLKLTAIASRQASTYGYRMRLSDDISGDGIPEVLLSGPGDDEVGENAGGVIAVPVPQ